jgi:hypothetical protein
MCASRQVCTREAMMSLAVGVKHARELTEQRPERWCITATAQKFKHAGVHTCTSDFLHLNSHLQFRKCA